MVSLMYFRRGREKIIFVEDVIQKWLILLALKKPLIIHKKMAILLVLVKFYSLTVIAVEM